MTIAPIAINQTVTVDGRSYTVEFLTAAGPNTRAASGWEWMAGLRGKRGALYAAWIGPDAEIGNLQVIR